jgi:membrane dipeptidase
MSDMTIDETPALPIVCDLHCDTVLEIQGGADLEAGNPDGHVDIPRLRKGGVGLQVFACFIPTVLPQDRAFREATDLLEEIDRVCDRASDHLRKVATAAQARAAIAEGKIGVLPAIENGHAIASDLRKLETLRRRGARYMTLTHSRHLEWAASSGEAFDGDHGLTPFGEEVVREMEALGMIIDVSHVHERTFWDVVRLAKKPFIASHSNAAALCPLGRNLTDDQLRAVAAAGGMVGINFFPGFLDPAYFENQGTNLDRLFADLEQLEREFADDPARKVAEMHRRAGAARAQQGPARADLDLVVDHITHIVETVGDDHVGFGSDFDGVLDLPRDIPDCGAFPDLLARMTGRGFGERSLAKIAGENFLRVLRDNDH